MPSRPPDVDSTSADRRGLGHTEPAEAPVTPRSILEALLFVGSAKGSPLSASQAAGLMRGVDETEIEHLVLELNQTYLDRGSPYHIVCERGGYGLQLLPEFQSLQNHFHGRLRRARLSQVAIDVLSLVAYRQPLSTEEVSKLRGYPSSHVLLQLVRRGLLRIERTQTRPRKTLHYTTQRFLELMELQSLEDLPKGQELEKP